MNRWRIVDKTWCLWPPRPKGLIEVIGGSYLSASPHISYRKLLEEISKENIAIHAWTYLPRLDHQKLSNEAWQDFKGCRRKLEKRVGSLPPPIKLGHSLGCKLHLIAPDSGRNSSSLVALSFNNFSANKSIPLLAEITPKLHLRSEFLPSPRETMKIILEHYIQPRNLLISFKEDKLDESSYLLEYLQNRPIDDYSQKIDFRGSHLTPVSYGLREKLLGNFAKGKHKKHQILQIGKVIRNWIKDELGP